MQALSLLYSSQQFIVSGAFTMNFLYPIVEQSGQKISVRVQCPPPLAQMVNFSVQFVAV